MPPTKTYGSLNPLLNIPTAPKATPTSGAPVTQPVQPTYKAPVKTAQSIVTNPYDALMTQAKNIQSQIPTATGLSTPATVYGTDLNSYSASDPYDTELGNQTKNASVTANQTISPEQIYRDKLKLYQKEIDAVNQLYAQKINTENIAGQGRLGSGRAIQARSGLLGSDFGSAQNDTIGQYNSDIVGGIRAEQTANIQKILGMARKDATEEAAAKTLAKSEGAASHLKFLGEQSTRKAAKFEDFLATLGDTDLSKVNPTNLAEVAKSYGVSVETLKAKAKEAKDATATAAKEADLKNRKGEAEILNLNNFNLSEGQSRYDAQGNIIASKGKTYAPESGGGSIGSGLGGVSSAAQNIIDQMNLGASMDDLIKGSSNAAQALRNEVTAGLNLQGGRTDKDNAFLKEAKSVADALVSSNAQNALGGHSTVLGGRYTTSYGDAKARINQLSSMLTRDNLGLLKGAMSDKDIAFINSMSSGIEGEGIQSEAFIKERIDSIQQKLADKIAKSTPITNNKPPTRVVNGVTYRLQADGTYE